MGRYMADHALTPDHAIVSTAVRTRETWRLLVDAFSHQPPVDFEDRIYEASPREIIATIAKTPSSAKTLLVVGHNPGLQEAGMVVTGSGDAKARDRFSAKFPTAALAVIDLDITDWAAIRPGSGRMERFVTPRALADAPD